MEDKSFDQLDPATQHVIDAFILCCEVDSSAAYMYPLATKYPKVLPSQLDERIAKLREIFAKDIQQLSPGYTDWQSNAATILEDAISIQRDMSDAVWQGASVAEYLERLTIPYPETVESGRSR